MAVSFVLVGQTIERVCTPLKSFTDGDLARGYQAFVETAYGKQTAMFKKCDRHRPRVRKPDPCPAACAIAA